MISTNLAPSRYAGQPEDGQLGRHRGSRSAPGRDSAVTKPCDIRVSSNGRITMVTDVNNGDDRDVWNGFIGYFLPEDGITTHV